MKAVITAKARHDLFIILATSRSRFGREGERRYRLLLEQAVADVAAHPHRRGVLRPLGGAGDICVYHSRRSAAQGTKDLRVGRPRHVLVFRVRGQTVEILRFLHDAMDLPRHFGDSLA